MQVYNTRLRVMSIDEVKARLNELKFKMWQHIETRNSYNINQQYVQFLEDNIIELKQRLEKKVA